ncbi:MAG: hypothetical protein KF773_39745 [Deltaproteobacteria bacterium]|nr:hypothetical protein [Deltaproteobacteria bacterium]MCW5801395.1 hypothetical protein [Deltaproteobacteria bacterium]
MKTFLGLALIGLATTNLAAADSLHPGTYRDAYARYATAGALDREGFSVGAYAAVQRLRDGGDAWTAELTLGVGRFRLTGAITRYDGVRAGDDRLPTSPLLRTTEGGKDERIPTLAQLKIGMRLDDGGPTHILAEAGFARAVMYTDVVLDADPLGAIGSLRVEHFLARRMAVLGEVSALRFVADVHATHLRAGVRIGPVEASFRRLAFNEGPPLYGPELGLRF